MQAIEAFQTLDGRVFTDERDAKRHATNRYADAISKLAHEVIRRGEKYVSVCEMLDDVTFLDRLLELRALRADMELGQ